LVAVLGTIVNRRTSQTYPLHTFRETEGSGSNSIEFIAAVSPAEADPQRMMMAISS